MGVPQNGWFTRENPIKTDDSWGYPYDLGTPQIVWTNSQKWNGWGCGQRFAESNNYMILYDMGVS